jgi:alkylhydroperoxidase/carboxymuconolactone decarboxylase family protein YurZ
MRVSSASRRTRCSAFSQICSVRAWLTKRSGRWGEPPWDDVLTWKERSLVVVSSLITQGGAEDRLRTHIHWAIANGATREELDALISMLTVYVGYPRAAAAMAVLIEELGPLDSGP